MPVQIYVRLKQWMKNKKNGVFLQLNQWDFAFVIHQHFVFHHHLIFDQLVMGQPFQPSCFLLWNVPLVFAQDDWDIYSFHINSTVTSRYATTVITSRVVNRMDESKEIEFLVRIPKNAFISKFRMWVLKIKQKTQELSAHKELNTEASCKYVMGCSGVCV